MTKLDRRQFLGVSVAGTVSLAVPGHVLALAGPALTAERRAVYASLVEAVVELPIQREIVADPRSAANSLASLYARVDAATRQSIDAMLDSVADTGRGRFAGLSPSQRLELLRRRLDDDDGRVHAAVELAGTPFGRRTHHSPVSFILREAQV